MGPVVVSLGLLVSTALLRSRDLMIPLWFGRHIMRWCAIGLLQLVFICFALLQRGFYFDEQRKLVVDLQSKLERDRLKHAESVHKGASVNLTKEGKREQELIMKNLKNPYM